MHGKSRYLRFLFLYTIYICSVQRCPKLGPKLKVPSWEANKLSPYSESTSSILTQTPPFAYAVIWAVTQTFSMDFLPPPAAQEVGGFEPGFESISNRITLNVCTIREMTTDASLYANCCPRQTLGPALKGRNMKGFGARYFCARSSKNRSGSNSFAVAWAVRALCA